jgi:hypothetical protein
MYYPLVITYEPENRLANWLRVRCPERRWLLRQVRNQADCAALLRPDQPAVLVLDGQDRPPMVVDMMQWAHEARPEVAVVLCVGVSQHLLAHAAWDLGVRHVVWLPQARAELCRVVEALVARQLSPSKVLAHDVIARASCGQ